MPRPRGARDADYDEKRQELLRRMTLRVMRRESARPSFRQLAEAASVSVPTLRYYFGGRSAVIAAILENYLRDGLDRLERIAAPTAPFEESIHDYGVSLLQGFRAPRQVKLGDVFAVAIAEGLLDAEIGPAALKFIVDPSVDTLQRRLRGHIASGEMLDVDTRAAALMLISPLLLAILHQDHMGGASCNPADLEAVVAEVCAAFVRAYRAAP
ncbi:TetR/AcrR family transcriptional regulator [Phenylobacterium sp.]|uniref:TetR/AcrR family transcriptional regulator n=1 Tax=Phenylobacterium sp. TaxID=1871053 RepID=UPI00378350E9